MTGAPRGPGGPARGEHRLRLALSLAGLGLLGAALVAAGPGGVAAMAEVAVVAGLFFGASALHSARYLWRARRR